MSKEEIDVHKADSRKILKEIIKTGDGELVANTASVKIHYTGSLLNGTKFDCSKERYGPFEFNVGEGAVIAGLELGIISMRKGEHAIFTIAPEYAYGSEGNPPIIPPNAVLKFDVELLDWEIDDLSPKKDGSIIRTHRIEKGIGYAFPHRGALVEVHLIGKSGDKMFDIREVIFQLGDGDTEKVIKGVEIALEKFKIGEKSTVIIQSKYAFDDPAFTDSGVPLGETVEYTIKLKQFEKLKESWSMDDDEKIQVSGMFKEKGNQHFNRKKYIPAINTYRKILEFLVEEGGEQIKTGDEDCSKLVLTANLNLALCCLRIEDYELAHKIALDAIRLAPDNDKAHYRCGQALLGLSDIESASRHFEICLKINPNNSEAKTQYSETTKILKNRVEKEKKRYLNMFDKFAEVDIQEGQLNKND